MELFQEDSMSSGSSLKLSDDSGIEDSWQGVDEHGAQQAIRDDPHSVMLDTDLSQALRGVELPETDPQCSSSGSGTENDILGTSFMGAHALAGSHSSIGAPFPLMLPLSCSSQYVDIEDDTAIPYLCGLQNIGNTCFMNAAFQCFLVSPLASILMREDTQASQHSHHNATQVQLLVKKQLKEIFQKQGSGKFSSVSTKEFHDALWKCNTPFTDFKQHDCQEFISHILNLVHDVTKEDHVVKPAIALESGISLDGVYEEQTKRLRLDTENTETDAGVECDDTTPESDAAWKKHLESNRSPVASNFQGQFKSTVTCEKCGHTSCSYETFMFLSLPIPFAMEQQIDVCWVPSLSSAHIQPTRHLVMVKKSASIDDLFTAFVKNLSASYARQSVVFAEVSGGTILRLLDGRMRLKYVNLDKNQVFAFELPLFSSSTSNEVICDSSKVSVSNGCQQTEEDVFQPAVTQTSTECAPTTASLSWHTCTICLEEMFDDELFVHLPCGGAMCGTCLQASAAFHNNDKFACPVCGTFVATADFVQPTPSPETCTRMVTIPRILRCSTSEGNNVGRSKNIIFGLPALVQLPCRGELSALRQAIKNTLPPWLPSCDWHVSITDASGLMCSICDPLSGCCGCRLEHGNEIRLKAGDAIVAHFDNCEVANGDFSLQDDVSMSKKRGSDAIYLEECLDAFTQTECLGADNPWHCSACDQSQTATKCLALSRIPNTVIIHLKRFYFDEGISKKITSPVIFPTENFLLTTASSLSDKIPDSASYNLTGIVNHAGSLMGGHYTARTRHPGTKKWTLYSDNVITEGPMSEEDMDKVYVLLYERQDPNA